MTISWVAAEKPSNTAARAIKVREASLPLGSMLPIMLMARMISSCAVSSHERLRPIRRVSNGSGSLSINGAQMNLNE